MYCDHIYKTAHNYLNSVICILKMDEFSYCKTHFSESGESHRERKREREDGDDSDLNWIGP